LDATLGSNDLYGRDRRVAFGSAGSLGQRTKLEVRKLRLRWGYGTAGMKKAYYGL
jgi:hypothetical protein